MSDHKYKIAKSFQVERDLRILKALAGGVASKDYLYRNFFIKKNGKLASRQAAERRLKKLFDLGYIERQTYKSMHHNGKQVFALAPLGVNQVCHSYGMERDFVRTGFPLPHKLSHELHLSQVIRTIWREEEQKNYKLIHLFDDSEMKRRVKPVKGVYYPDLHVLLETRTGNQLAYYLELDCGVKTRSYWIAKISSWKNDILFMTLSRARLELMKSYVQQHAQHTALEYKIAFCVADDFYKAGLSNTWWNLLPDNVVARIKM